MRRSPRPFFAIDQRGTVRRTICVGSWAVKIARNGEAAMAAFAKSWRRK
jgi:hypothetical protein